MIRIIKAGRIRKYHFKGTCWKCGCEFWASEDEVQRHTHFNETGYSMKCPTVGCDVKNVFCDKFEEDDSQK